MVESVVEFISVVALSRMIDYMCRPAFLTTPLPTAANKARISGRGMKRCTVGGNRTPNLRIWNPLLYQLSYDRNAGDNSTAEIKIVDLEA